MMRNVQNKVAAKTGRARRFRPQIEVLEERCLLSASATDYRPIDEVGNNIANPTWGSEGIDLLRLSPVAYADGISAPSLPNNPSPRTISNIVFNQTNPLFGPPSEDINTVDGNSLSDFGYVFGQFVDHDMDLTPDDGTENTGPGDFPIPADPNQPDDPIGSLAFGRSVYDPTTGTSTSNPRQQIQAVTSYLDLSQVYGSTQEVAGALRTHSGGLLKTSPGNLLPYDNTTYFTPDQIAALNMQNSGPLPEDQLFAAGDVRANENVELTALQTLFVRNHNAIATELAQQDPTQFGFTSWTDEDLYQEARKINIAEYQDIIYTQYLPDLLGPDAMPAYTGYDPNVNATIATEFSTVAFRFGHSLLNNTVARDGNNGSTVSAGNVPLALDFFDPNLINPNGVVDPTTGLTSTGIGAFLKGDADNHAQALDSMAVSSVRDLLFGNGIPGGEDLISRDIQRARDNGIGTYNQVREAFGLAPVTSFAQITSNVTVQQELQEAYGSVDNIDPFVGGMAEDHVPGSDMGPLFTSILVNQFTRLETGDRYFYLNESWPPAEMNIFQQGNTLAKIIEANTNVKNLQPDVFKFTASISGTVSLTQNENGDQSMSPGRGLAGITVQLQDTSRDVLATTTTDSRGHYTFTQQSGPSANPEIAPGVSSTGDYNVILILPPSLRQTTSNPPTIHISRGGLHVRHVNFGVEAVFSDDSPAAASPSATTTAAASPTTAITAAASSDSGIQLAVDAGLMPIDLGNQPATNVIMANTLVGPSQAPANTGTVITVSMPPASGPATQAPETNSAADGMIAAVDTMQDSSSQAGDATTLDDPSSDPLQALVI
jgi:peroxidase